MSTSLSKPDTYIGNGQPDVWNDPLNWANGLVPGATDFALVPKSAILNGPIAVNVLMLLGNETDTISGQIKTLSTNVCESFMVCEGATANFVAGATLLDAGGLECGIDNAGTIDVAGASGGVAAATLNAVELKLGQFNDGVGTLNLAGTLNVSGGSYIGFDGKGTVNMTGGSQANFAGLTLGDVSGATGTLHETGNANASVAGWLSVGTSAAGAPGGTGAISLGGRSTLYCDHSIMVNAGSSVALNGGTLATGPDGTGLQIRAGAVVSGTGSLSCAVHGVTDNGTLEALGGTLAVSGNLSGIGMVEIGAGSTLNLNASKIVVPSIAFLGTGDTLGLTTGVYGTFTLSGFGLGDTIVMSGIDAASWSGSSGILTLSEHGQVMDRLTLTGVAANAMFHVTPGANGSDIAMLPGTTGITHTI